MFVSFISIIVHSGNLIDSDWAITSEFKTFWERICSSFEGIFYWSWVSFSYIGRDKMKESILFLMRVRLDLISLVLLISNCKVDSILSEETIEFKMFWDRLSQSSLKYWEFFCLNKEFCS